MPMLPDSLRSLAHALTVAALVLAGLILGKEILAPLFAAAVIAFILAPLVSWLHHRGSPRGVAAAFVMVVFVSTLGLLLTAFSAQVISLTADMSLYTENLVRKVRDITGPGNADGVIARAMKSISVLDRELRRELQTGGIVSNGGSGGTASTSQAHTGSGIGLQDLMPPIAGVSLMLVFTTFLLVQFQDMRDRLLRVGGVDNLSVTSAALEAAADRLSHLFALQAVLNGAFGAFIGVALAIIGVPHALLWGGATVLLRFVPFIGSILAAGPPLVLAAGVASGWSMVLETIALFTIGEVVISQIIEPRYLGKSAGISPLAFILAASFWTMVWGPVGLILAAPLTTLAVVAGQFVPQLEFVTVLLGDAPPLTPVQEFYHRLVSNDPIAALLQFRSVAETSSRVAAGEEVVLPALHLAAIDSRLGRIDGAKVQDIGKVVEEFTDMLKVDERAERQLKVASNGMKRVAVIAARGRLDEMATSVVAEILRLEVDWVVLDPAMGSGLTALGGLMQALGAREPDCLVIVTITDNISPVLRIIEHKAKSALANADIVVCRPSVTTGGPTEGGDGIFTLAKLVNHLTSKQQRQNSVPLDSAPVPASSTKDAA